MNCPDCNAPTVSRIQHSCHPYRRAAWKARESWELWRVWAGNVNRKACGDVPDWAEPLDREP